jgi:hypothetical protein
MNIAKAEFITETRCYIAFLNRHYNNPPLETSTLDCIAAKRLLPCSLCLTRAKKTLDFPAPESTPTFPPLQSVSAAKHHSTGPKKRKETRKERESAKNRLTEFRNSICSQEHKSGRFVEHPQTMFLPSSILTIILDKLLSISSLSDLQSLVQNWRHREAHSAGLHKVIIAIETDIQKGRRVARDTKNAASRQKRAAKRKADELSDSSSDNCDDEISYDSDSSLPETIPLPARSTRSTKRLPTKSTTTAARPALKSVTNLKRSRRAPLLSVAQTVQEYGRNYKPRLRS